MLSNKDLTTSPAEGEWSDAHLLLLKFVEARTGHSFLNYKISTIQRRIDRRIEITHCHGIDEYLSYVQFHNAELELLFEELLIGVTQLFRDPEAFEHLLKVVLPEYFLAQVQAQAKEFRVWIPACSTGEEAYSMAIILQEFLTQRNLLVHVQIFATDLSQRAIQKARYGRFSFSELNKLPLAYLSHYFVEEKNNQFTVSRNVRKMLIFAQQNIAKDPPFTRCDLICCRNLLIYFNSQLQRRMFPLFHYSLKERGLLFLGPSESVGQFSNLFDIKHKKWKIYESKTCKKNLLGLFDAPKVLTSMNDDLILNKKIEDEKVNFSDLLRSLLVFKNAQPFVVVNNKNEVIYVHGKTGDYLEPAEGSFQMNILDMARPGLKLPVKECLQRAQLTNEEVAMTHLKIASAYTHREVDISARSIQVENRPKWTVLHFSLSAVQQDSCLADKKESVVQDRNLEIELQRVKEHLYLTIGELETANEELRSSNEELQSTNEELQSTAEEMETSKEELQSLHEESTTINAELQDRIDELTRINDDIKNLLDSTEIATLFLDMQLCIRRYTQKITDVLPLEPTDIGRSVQDFNTKLRNIDLGELADQVINDLMLREYEVEGQNGSSYILRIRPYRTTKNVINGVVMTFQDMTSFQKYKLKA